MRRPRDLSIKTKLILLSTVCAALALALCCTGFVAYNVHTARQAKVKRLRAQARMLAFNSTAVLTFHDGPAAKRLLESLQSQPSVEVGCLYDWNDQLLASYRRDGQRPFLPPDTPGQGHSFTDDGYLDLFQPVIDDGERVGTLYLRANMHDLQKQFLAYLRIGGIVLVGALTASFILTMMLQRGISRPILQLSRIAGQITNSDDYSVRVQPPSQDELGRLYSSFNRMLDRVESSRNALKAAVANMSHEIRTPINAILGFTDLLRKGADEGDPKKRTEFLQTIHTSGRHLLNLINNILDLSKIEAGQLDIEQVRCSPQQIISEVVSVMSVRAHEKGIELECEATTGLPETIVSDPARLRQLLINLVGNSIKFTDAGEVRIAARLTEDGPRPQLALDVIDTGAGISPETLEIIFEPFRQADTSLTRPSGGTGLGLAISRQIAQLLGGDITVRSQLGTGSVFTATVDTGPLDGVPILRQPLGLAAEFQPGDAETGDVKLPEARVLLVEDGATNRKLIQLILRRAGLKVETAENGQIAVERATSETFDLILMDMQMPVMDGFSATRQLRSLKISVPVIALTAHAMKGDEQKCRDAGCTEYLTKPVNSSALLETIAKVLQDAPTRLPSTDDSQDEADWTEKGRPSGIPDEEDPELREIAQDFLDSLSQRLDQMQTAFEENDLQGLAGHAHWLKGTAGTVGFPSFTDPARQLETLAEEGRMEAIHATLQDIADLAEAYSASSREPQTVTGKPGEPEG